MDVKYHAVKYDIRHEYVVLETVASEDNVADAFTKPLGRVKFERFRTMMGVVPAPALGRSA